MKMTIEKAIERLEWFKNYNEEDYCGGDRIEVDGDWYYYMDARDFEVFEMAIAALKRCNPCDLCRYAPASSADGKPCTMCPAERRQA